MKQKIKKGFTLLEMVIVLFIISLLILIILPNISSQKKNAKNVSGDAMVQVVQTQVDLYENEYNELPADLSDLQEKGYLSDKQISQANRDGISIDGDKVVEK